MKKDLWNNPWSLWEFIHHIEKEQPPENDLPIVELLIQAYPHKEEIQQKFPPWSKKVFTMSSHQLKWMKTFLLRLWKKHLPSYLEKKKYFFEKIFAYALNKFPEPFHGDKHVFFHLFYWIDFEWQYLYQTPLIGLSYYKIHQDPWIKEWNDLIENTSFLPLKHFNDPEFFLYLKQYNDIEIPFSIQKVVDPFLNPFMVSSLELIRLFTSQDAPFKRAGEGKKIKYKDVIYRKAALSDEAKDISNYAPSSVNF